MQRSTYQDIRYFVYFIIVCTGPKTTVSQLIDLCFTLTDGLSSGKELALLYIGQKYIDYLT